MKNALPWDMRTSIGSILVLLAASGVGSLRAGVVTSSVSGTATFFPGGPDPVSCSGITSCSFAAGSGTFPFDSADGLYSTVAPSPQTLRVEALSRSDAYNADVVGNSMIIYSDTLMFTGGTGSGTLLFSIEYLLTAVSEVCVNCGGVSAAFNDYHANAHGLLTTTTLEYPFTFGTPFDITMSASARAFASFHELASSDARIQVDSITIVTPEPTTVALAALSMSLIWGPLRWWKRRST